VSRSGFRLQIVGLEDKNRGGGGLRQVTFGRTVQFMIQQPSHLLVLNIAQSADSTSVSVFYPTRRPIKMVQAARANG